MDSFQTMIMLVLNYYMRTAIAALSIFFTPLLTKAAGLVPCEAKIVAGKMTDGCGFCEMGQLVKGVADWFAIIFGIVVVIIIIVAGLRMVLSVGNVSAKSGARRLISSALIGYAILLGSWMIVDTFLKFMIPGSSYGVGNPLICS